MTSPVALVECIEELVSLLTECSGGLQRPAVKKWPVFLRAELEVLGGAGRSCINGTRDCLGENYVNSANCELQRVYRAASFIQDLLFTNLNQEI